MFTESLTVHILGDSSGLRAELEGALHGLNEFQSRLTSITSSGDQLASSLGGVGKVGPALQSVSQLLNRITTQIRLLGQSPVTIDVSPALAALQRLLGMIELAAARLKQLTGGPAGNIVGGPTALPAASRPGSPAVGLPDLAGAGASANYSARLDAANSSIVNIDHLVAPSSPIGSPGVAASDGTRSSRSTAQDVLSAGGPTSNFFGGIAINVQSGAEVNNIVRDLRLQGIHLRHRRG
ncbi:MAG: hypothetical protein R3B90_05610 [Planctomycetaceae bacterium]